MNRYEIYKCIPSGIILWNCKTVWAIEEDFSRTSEDIQGVPINGQVVR